MKVNEYVLVTGASSKLGKLIAEILAEKNYNLLLHYYKSKNETVALAKKLGKQFKNQNFQVMHIDLSKEYSTNTFTKILYSKVKDISGIINNASRYENDQINNFDKDNFESNINIHFKNPTALISVISKKLLSQNKQGFAINITDKMLNRENYFSYNVSKTLLSNWNSNNIEKTVKIIEFKPGNLMPSKNSKKTIQNFKQNFSELIEYNDGYIRR